MLPVTAGLPLIREPVGNHDHLVRVNIPVFLDKPLHLRGQSHHPVRPAENAAVDVVHQPADGISLPDGMGAHRNLRIKVIGYKNQLTAKQGLGPGGHPGQDGRVGIDHHRFVPGQLPQVQKHHEGEGKVVDQAAKYTLPVQLDVLEPMNTDALQLFPDGNACPVKILSRIAAEHIHGVAPVAERLYRIVRQLGRGDVFRVKKLTQEYDIPFPSHVLALLMLCFPFFGWLPPDPPPGSPVHSGSAPPHSRGCRRPCPPWR